MNDGLGQGTHVRFDTQRGQIQPKIGKGGQAHAFALTHNAARGTHVRFDAQRGLIQPEVGKGEGKNSQLGCFVNPYAVKKSTRPCSPAYSGWGSPHRGWGLGLGRDIQSADC